MQVTEFLFLENRTSQKKPESNDMDDGIDSARDRRERERRRLILGNSYRTRFMDRCDIASTRNRHEREFRRLNIDNLDRNRNMSKNEFVKK